MDITVGSLPPRIQRLRTSAVPSPQSVVVVGGSVSSTLVGRGTPTPVPPPGVAREHARPDSRVALHEGHRHVRRRIGRHPERSLRRRAARAARTGSAPPRRLGAYSQATGRGGPRRTVRDRHRAHHSLRARADAIADHGADVLAVAVRMLRRSTCRARGARRCGRAARWSRSTARRGRRRRRCWGWRSVRGRARSARRRQHPRPHLAREGRARPAHVVVQRDHLHDEERDDHRGAHHERGRVSQPVASPTVRLPGSSARSAGSAPAAPRCRCSAKPEAHRRVGCRSARSTPPRRRSSRPRAARVRFADRCATPTRPAIRRPTRSTTAPESGIRVSSLNAVVRPRHEVREVAQRGRERGVVALPRRAFENEPERVHGRRRGDDAQRDLPPSGATTRRARRRRSWSRRRPSTSGRPAAGRRPRSHVAATDPVPASPAGRRSRAPPGRGS